MQDLKVKRLVESAKVPTKMTVGSAGLDLYAAKETIIPAAKVNEKGFVDIGRELVSSGLAVEIPRGMVGRIASRSGLSVKYNIEVGAGWIDSDYRGEILIELKNFSAQPFLVKQGERVAQLVILNLGECLITEIQNLNETTRGEGGFGSTGVG
jgi:dUTP pyrophosphatase